MKKHVLILGAGFGGLELATQLSESYGDAVRVTLLDRNDSFFVGFSKLEVMLGRQSSDDVRLYYREIAKDGVEFRQERVTAIDPATRKVITDSRSYDADLVRGSRARRRGGHRGDDLGWPAAGPIRTRRDLLRRVRRRAGRSCISSVPQ